MITRGRVGGPVQGIRSIVDLKLSPDAQRQIAGADGERFVWLPIHDRIQEQMLEFASHGGGAVLVGARRSGKTLSLWTVSHRINQPDRSAGAHSVPVQVITVSTSHTSAHVLRDLALTAGTVEAFEGDTAELVDLTVAALVRNGTRLVCVDDAHKLGPEAIGLLLNLPDVARCSGWDLGIMLVGRPGLLDDLH